MALHLLTESDVAELRRLRAKIDSITGVGVTNAPDSVSIVPPPVVQTVVTDRPRGGAAGPLPMRVDRLEDGVVYARRISGIDAQGDEVLGNPEPVALPDNLRGELSSLPQIGQISGVAGGSVQVVSSGFGGSEAGISETWQCIPVYATGALIFAIEVSYTAQSINGTPVTLLDTNVDARAWVSF